MQAHLMDQEATSAGFRFRNLPEAHRLGDQPDHDNVARVFRSGRIISN